MRYNKTVGCINIHIDTKRIDNNLRQAQDKLDQCVLKDMTEYMPFQQGALRGATHIVEPGLISTDTPYAHYQYEGELYLAANGSSWAHKGEKKYPSGQPLRYHTPGTGDHWFEMAKNVHGNEWVDLVKREVGKGSC